ncbi:MAG: alkylation repair protein [Frondihabitans sp.]|nr:alkylation repair protein [Frondihabitans sp.]
MPFADELIGVPTALTLIAGVQAAAPDRTLSSLRATPDRLAPLALRERSDLLRDALLTDLDGSFDDLAATVRRAAAGTLPFSGWLIWPVTSAVAERAVQDGSEAAFDDALSLLAELTSRLTSEFAIRTLLRHDLPRALGTIQAEWVTSDDVDVRRLASEGTRPYLPWSTRVPGILADPESTVPLLTALYRDDSEYVRRSVANHLNDISRANPALVVETARAWLRAPDENTERLVGRALRTLVKRGDPGALALLGFTPAALDVAAFALDRATAAIGETVTFSAAVTNTGDEPARLSIDYAVHHRKANGESTGKTFKLAVRTLSPGEKLTLVKQHSFRVITTRRYHPGTHAIELLINGVSFGRREFELTAPA